MANLRSVGFGLLSWLILSSCSDSNSDSVANVENNKDDNKSDNDGDSEDDDSDGDNAACENPCGMCLQKRGKSCTFDRPETVGCLVACRNPEPPPLLEDGKPCIANGECRSGVCLIDTCSQGAGGSCTDKSCSGGYGYIEGLPDERYIECLNFRDYTFCKVDCTNRKPVPSYPYPPPEVCPGKIGYVCVEEGLGPGTCMLPCQQDTDCLHANEYCRHTTRGRFCDLRGDLPPLAPCTYDYECAGKTCLRDGIPAGDTARGAWIEKPGECGPIDLAVGEACFDRAQCQSGVCEFDSATTLSFCRPAATM